MHPLLVIAVPLVLIILGVIMNSWGLAFDQPPSSPEQDLAERLAAERESFRVKLPQGDKKSDAATKEAVAEEKVSSWELGRLGTALSIGDNALPRGIALKISN